jgi:hypothetical protein
MQVKFSSKQMVAGKWYQKGEQAVLPDRLMYTSAFKALIRASAVSVLPRDAATQKLQAAKDAKSHKAAQAKKPSDAEITSKAHTAVAAKWQAKAAAHAKAGDSMGSQLARAYSAHHTAKAESVLSGKPVEAPVIEAVKTAQAAAHLESDE